MTNVDRLESIALRTLRWCLLIGATSYLGSYLILAMLRMRYPFELEWIEGGIADQVQRILHGRQVYVPPSVEFVPFVYTPLYFYASALLAKLIGGGFLPLRLVSFLASLGCFAMILLTVYRATRDRFIAFLSACFFVASYRVTGAWFDVGRVDSLFLFWYLVFVYCVTTSVPSPKTYLLAGVFGGLAFLTKQTALTACAPVVLYCLFRSWRHTLILIGTALALVGTVTMAFSLTSGRWYLYYTFYLLNQQTDWVKSRLISFWTEDLFGHVTIGLVAGLFYLTTALYRDRSSFWTWSLITAGALATSFVSRIKDGGYDNVLMPIYAIVAILLGLGAHRFIEIFRAEDEHRRRPAMLWLYIVLISQFALFCYNPRHQLPKPADEQAGRNFLSLVASVDGPVYIPHHGYLATMAEKKTFAQHSAIWDVLRGKKKTEAKAILAESLDQAIREQTFSMLILDSSWHYLSNLEQFYEQTGTVISDPKSDVFFPVTGFRIRPSSIWTPKHVMGNAKTE